MNNCIHKTAPPKRVVVIGGGTGSSTLLSGLSQHNVSLSAIVTMFDNGGSSGNLRREFSYPPFGDLRQCLLALSSDSPENRGHLVAVHAGFGNLRLIGSAELLENANPKSEERVKFLCSGTEASHVF